MQGLTRELETTLAKLKLAHYDDDELLTNWRSQRQTQRNISFVNCLCHCRCLNCCGGGDWRCSFSCELSKGVRLAGCRLTACGDPTPIPAVESCIPHFRMRETREQGLQKRRSVLGRGLRVLAAGARSSARRERSWCDRHCDQSLSH